MRGGDGDADSRKAAGTDSDQDSAYSPALKDFGDHRHEPFGMSSADDFIGAGDARPGAIEQRDGAGCAGCVECEQHFGSDDGHMRLNPATPETQIASTVSTSGT